jgi:hypothetical protein
MKRICVFCGSNPGLNPTFAEAAREMGAALARRGLGLVYGGGCVGLMGVVADAVLAEGGEVIGVIPGALVARELAHNGVTELRIVRSMHERKAAMESLSDGFVALPGGLGTFEEICEMLTWAQLGLHRKPCAVLDVEGYYDPLLALLDRAVAEGFLRPQYRALLLASREPEDLLDRMAAYQPRDVPKWIESEES